MAGRQAVSLLVLLAFLPACMGWQNVDVARPKQITTGKHTLELNLRNGRMVRLEQARAVGDSLIGVVPEKGGLTRTAIPLAEVQRLRGERVKTLPSVLLIVGVVGTVTLALTADAINEGCCFSLGRIP